MSTIIENAVRPFAAALAAAFADPTSVRSPDAFSKVERKGIAAHVQSAVMMFPHVAPTYAIAAVSAIVNRNAGANVNALSMRPDAVDTIDADALTCEIETIRTAAHKRADDAAIAARDALKIDADSPIDSRTQTMLDKIVETEESARAAADKSAADAATFVVAEWANVVASIVVYRAAGNGRVKTPDGKLDADIAVALALTIAGKSISGKMFARAMGYVAPKREKGAK